MFPFKQALLHLSLILQMIAGAIRNLLYGFNCIYMGYNPLAAAHGLSSRTDAQTIQLCLHALQYLNRIAMVVHNSTSIAMSKKLNLCKLATQTATQR